MTATSPFQGLCRWRSDARRDAAAGIVAAFLTCVSVGSFARADAIADFDAWAKNLAGTVPEQQSAVVTAYVTEQSARGGFPLIAESGEAVFVYVAAPGETDVRLLGDFYPRSFFNPYWVPQGEPMERLVPGAVVFVKRLHSAPDARLNYAFRIQGQYRLDPLNPHTDVGGPQGDESDTVSELAMPGFRPPTEADASSDDRK